jgi:hypothetical protein
MRFLHIYAAFLTIAVIILFFLLNKQPHFKEIDAERINIIESDGTTPFGLNTCLSVGCSILVILSNRYRIPLSIMQHSEK